MDYFWWLYLATRLDEIKSTFHGGLFLSGMGFAIIMFVSFMCFVTDENIPSFIKPWRWILPIIFLLCTIGNVLTPSKKDAMFIAGGVGVVEAAKAVQGSEIAKKSVAIVEQWLGNNLVELQKKGEELKKGSK